MTANRPPHLSLHEIALFLDFDGTLVEIESEPGAVKVPTRLRDTLARLSADTSGALAIVTGRKIERIDTFLAPLHLPCAGLHGLERRVAGSHIETVVAESRSMARVRDRLRSFASRTPGVLVEDKGLTLAVHYRKAPHREAEVSAAVAEAIDIARGDFVLLQGKMVFELKPPGIDKGSAIESFMPQPPFCGRVPVFAGDDITDEAAFRAVNRAGGRSIRVGSGGTTSARYQLENVAAMLNWLDGLRPEKAA